MKFCFHLKELLNRYWPIYIQTSSRCWANRFAVRIFVTQCDWYTCRTFNKIHTPSLYTTDTHSTAYKQTNVFKYKYHINSNIVNEDRVANNMAQRKNRIKTSKSVANCEKRKGFVFSLDSPCLTWCQTNWTLQSDYDVVVCSHHRSHFEYTLATIHNAA